MNHGLVNRVRRLVGKDARRQARHRLANLSRPIQNSQFHGSVGPSPSRVPNSNLVFVGGMENIVVDEKVVSQKVKLVLHVLEQSAHHGSQVNNMRRLVFVKDSFRRSLVPTSQGGQR
jgi:hypothetical protein